MIYQILGVFHNTLTANEKYLVQDCEILTSPIKMKLSLKPKTFIDSFVCCLESTSNFKHFEKRTIVIATLFRKLYTTKNLDRPLSKKHHFRITVDVPNFYKTCRRAFSCFSLLWENLICKISPLVTW